MEQSLKLKVELQEAWMKIENPKLSVDEAVVKLEQLGNNVIKVDHKNRRILVAQGEK